MIEDKESLETEDEDVEPDEAALEEEDEDDGAPAPEPVESSLDELIAKKEEPEAETAEGPEEAILPSTAERIEPLAVKVVPQQPTEFTCRNCFLVKHRSQLKNKKRMLCRDCA